MARVALVLLVAWTAATGQSVVMSWNGPAPGGGFGTSLAGPGDLNGDGVPDLAVGATGPPGYVTAYSGHDGSVIWQAFGGPTDGFGVSVAAGGDVDGDGRQDIVVAAKGVWPTLGYTRILSGATGGTIRTIAFTTRQVDGGRDFNGDSVPDQLGAYDHVQPSGVRVFSGVDGSTLFDVTDPLFGTGATLFPMKGAFIEDVDQDGYDDLLVATSTGIGTGILFRGPYGTFFGSVSGTGIPQIFGLSVFDAGDVNLDGRHDAGILLDLNFFTTPVLRVYDSLTGWMIWQTQASLAAPGLGPVSRLPDLDGDGVGELATCGGSPTGISVLSGSTGVPILAIPVGVTPGPGSVATIGDITGDGVPEIVGSYSTSSFGGTVSVLSIPTLASAAVYYLGGFCGMTTNALSMTPPQIGSTIQILIAGNAYAAPAVLLVDANPNAPTPLGACVFHLNLANAASWLQIPLTLSAVGDASFLLPIPPIPSLIGATATLQLAVLGSSAPLGVDLSNGILVTVGL